MESKLNLNAVKEYSVAFAKDIADQAFTNQDNVSGQDILTLTPVKQINLFIINDLLNKWRGETQKVRSPYFNFEAPQVQEALQEFMNTLSQHIAVDRHHLLPLIEVATQNTLLLLLDPHFFYYQVLSNVQFGLRPENIKELFKYIKINRTFPELLLQHLEKEKKDEIHASYALWLLDEKSEQVEQKQEEASTYLNEFSKVRPVEKYTFNQHHQLSESPPVPAFSSERKFEKLDEAPKTLNDYLNQTAGTTLADIHQKRKIDSLRNYISVNQRFMFIRELFGNSQEEFNRALTTLEQHNTYVEAFNYLRNEYATKYRWRMDSEEVVELLEIVSKRYH